jgi:hypothetical protein
MSEKRRASTAEGILADMKPVPHEPGKPADAVDLYAKVVTDLAALRANGRIPVALGLLVELPGLPAAGQRGSNCTINVPFATAEADPGLLGAAVRALTRNSNND